MHRGDGRSDRTVADAARRHQSRQAGPQDCGPQLRSGGGWCDCAHPLERAAAARRSLGSLRSWISRNNLEDSETTLEGDAAAERFTMRVGGSRGYAERKVLQLMGSLRKQDGTYERFACADATGEEHEVFVSTDKPPAMVRRELGLKKIKNVVAQIKPGLKLFSDTIKGEISCQWKPLVRLVPQPGDTPPQLSFANANLESFGIAVPDLRRQLLAAFVQENAVQWSV
eukprot:9486425-Pyramimonas_sp.AAC.1